MNTWHIFLLPQFPNPDKTCFQTRLNNKWATQERHFLRFPLRKLISPFFASTWERRKRNRVVIALRRISFPLLLSLPCSIDSLRRRRAGHTHAPPWVQFTGKINFSEVTYNLKVKRLNIYCLNYAHVLQNNQRLLFHFPITFVVSISTK